MEFIKPMEILCNQTLSSEESPWGRKGWMAFASILMQEHNLVRPSENKLCPALWEITWESELDL